MDTNSVMTIAEAARQLRMTRSALYKAIELGKIRADVVLGRRVLDKRDVAAYQPRPYGEHRAAKSPDESADYDSTLTPAERVRLLEAWADDHERGEEPLLSDAALSRAGMYAGTGGER